MRRYRYAHLRNKSNVPMSIKNEDRHGLAHLKHDDVKILDRLHFPPWFLFIFIGVPVGMVIFRGF